MIIDNRRGRAWLPLAAALTASLGLTSCAKSAPELPYGTVQMMMAKEVQPTAQKYWDAVRFVSELVDGKVVNTDHVPQTEAEWLEVEAAAAHLAELGEALKTPAYAEGRGEDWPVFAQGLVDLAGRAGEAAKSRDPEQVFASGGELYNVCSACHQAYPATASPPADPVADPAADAAN